MNANRERVIIGDPNVESREVLRSALEAAAYDVAAFASEKEALEAALQNGADLVIFDAAPANRATARATVASVHGTAATEGARVILLVGEGGAERAAALDIGADEAVSRPLDMAELLARVRAQLRVRREGRELREKTRIAEQGQQIAHTAFEALAVTEKMASDATTLDRRLKFGLIGVFSVAVVMAGIYFLFAHTAQKQTQRSNAVIARLEGGLVSQQNLIAEARKLRSSQDASDAPPLLRKDELQKHAADLKAKMANPGSDDVASLQKELAETNARLKRVEQEGQSAENMIAQEVGSVCLLHVSVAFRDQQSNQRLRYAGLNQQGEPLQDSEGNPILTVEGKGPEVKLDVFGTGFVAGAGGRLITNRHVAEPWWKNDEIKSLTSEGLQPEISTIRAYFPGDVRAFHAEIQQISSETDLAAIHVDLEGLNRSVLSIDAAKSAAATGEAVVSMGYATGLAAILARTDEESAQQILKSSGGDVGEVLKELAHRGLIRPTITQGHIGDILPDKIVFDAQTTSGGSGGPLFNEHGKVIGVTYAVLKGFGGSNFGIPIRFSQPLLVLKQAP
jgi:DNA-binding response OmpR family regulator/S1-C subfamily serine protease